MQSIPLPNSGSLILDYGRDDTAEPRNRYAFGVFVLLNFVLFIRPGEILPAVNEIPFFEILMILCALFSLGPLGALFEWRSLSKQPVLICVLALVPAVVVSNLIHGNMWDARMGLIAFLKVVLYLLMLVSLVDTPQRLRTFLMIIAIFLVLIAALAILQYHGYVQIESLTPVAQGDGEEEGAEMIFRLVGPGIFNDPNDFSLVLIFGILMFGYLVMEPGSWVRRLAWLAPAAVLIYALQLTQSRGGFLSLLGGVVAFSMTRFGWKRSLLLMALGLPFIFLAFGGRQTDLSMDQGDTGIGRVLLWRESLILFHGAPIFGIGYGQLADQNEGMVAHNSFVHAYAELGIVGGTIFVGIWYVFWRGFTRIGRAAWDSMPRSVRSMNSLLFAQTAAYAVGLFSLSRVYGMATYFLIGVSAAYFRLVSQFSEDVVPHWNKRLVKGIMLASFGLLVFLHVIVKVLAR